MPAWWSKKSSKSKEESQHSSSSHFNFIKFPAHNKSDNEINRKKSGADDQKTRSMDDVVFTRNSPRESRDFAMNGAGSSGFSGFDSDSTEKRGHPLPRPSVSSIHSDHASASVSSVSSSGSSDDHVVAVDQSPVGGYRSYGDPGKMNSIVKSPGRGGSRGPTSPTSPLHQRLSGVSLVDSPSGSSGSGQCHRLPLPPGSPSSPSSPLSTSSRPDNTLSNWKKGKLLGRGTFGHVYMGFNSEKGQMCAIKEVRVVCDDQTSRESLKQLNQEINLLSQLQHPNIVRYYGSELSEQTLSVYLEYVSGGSIYKLLQEYGSFREPVIQTYTRQILLGLAYLHARNTVHRDIKGANILVDPNGEIKLADFGMAKHITACSSMLSFKGSPYWMAPEVVMNTNGYSLAVDIWSLGCTVLEMATSKPPWSQYEGVAAIFKIGNSKDIPDIPDHLSNEAKNFIKLCLHRDPSARSTASQLLDHPFVRDQGTVRSATFPVAKDSFPYTFDGSRTPPVLDLHPTRKSITLGEGDYITKPMAMTSRTSNSPTRENIRAITSLPVSPCSSPLRQYGATQKSSYLSPPHPTFASVGQNAFNLGEYSGYATMKSNTTRYVHDPLLEPSFFKAHTPGASPRRRPI